MRKITTISIVANDAFENDNILCYIKQKTLNYLLDLKVGDKIAYNTNLFIYNEKCIVTGIEGTIKDIVNFISNDYIDRTIAIEVTPQLLKEITWRRNSMRDKYLKDNNIDDNENSDKDVSEKQQTDINFE